MNIWGVHYREVISILSYEAKVPLYTVEVEIADRLYRDFNDPFTGKRQ